MSTSLQWQTLLMLNSNLQLIGLYTPLPNIKAFVLLHRLELYHFTHRIRGAQNCTQN